MRLAMAQMAMTDNIDENADRALATTIRPVRPVPICCSSLRYSSPRSSPSMRTAMRRDISWT